MAKVPKVPRMLTHDQIWTALDRLAERAGITTSALAKRAGRLRNRLNAGDAL